MWNLDALFEQPWIVLGLSYNQFQSLVAALLILALVVLPQVCFSAADTPENKKLLELAIERHNAARRKLHSKITDVVSEKLGKTTAANKNIKED